MLFEVKLTKFNEYPEDVLIEDETVTNALWRVSGKVPKRIAQQESHEDDFCFYIVSNSDRTSVDCFSGAAAVKLPSRGDPGLPRPLPEQRERKVSPHRQRKRGRRSLYRSEARRSPMRDKRRMNRSDFRIFKKHVLPNRLGRVAVQPISLATQEAQGQTKNSRQSSLKLHVIFKHNRRKHKLLQKQPKVVSPEENSFFQTSVDRLSEKLSYARNLRIATCNIPGLKITDRENLIFTMMTFDFEHWHHVHSRNSRQSLWYSEAGWLLVCFFLWNHKSAGWKCPGNSLESVSLSHQRWPAKFSDAEVRLIYGDFNARLHHVHEEDSPHIGPHILGRGLRYLNNYISPNSLFNRELFVEFLKSLGFRALNFHFLKDTKQLCTYSEVFNSVGGPPWDTVRCAQIDFVLASARWQNAFKNVESLPDVQVDSDHFVFISSVQIKLKASKKPHARRRIEFRQPWQEQVHFNSRLLQSCSSLPDLATDITTWLRAFSSNILNYAKGSFSPVPPLQQKSYLLDETWQLIELKHWYRRTGQKSAELETRNLVRRLAKRDRKLHVIRSFEQAQDMDEKWKSTKTARQKYIPQFVRFKNLPGNYTDLSQKASATADYLANEQQKPPEPCPPKILGKSWLTIFTLMTVISLLRNLDRSLKKNKAPGPDDISADLLKPFDDSSLQFVSLLLNDCWNRSSIPDDLEVARVTSIFRKGNLELLSNYRPISFLSVFYKLLLHLFSVDSGQK